MLEGLLADNSPKNLLAVDKSIDRIFDLEDATKVFCQGKKIIRIGKLIPEYNGVDCGLFKLKKNFFPAQKKAIDRGLDQLSHGIQVLLDEGDFEAHFIRDNCHWLDVDTIEALKYAQNNIHLFE
jgi:choline kinase